MTLDMKDIEQDIADNKVKRLANKMIKTSIRIAKAPLTADISNIVAGFNCHTCGEAIIKDYISDYLGEKKIIYSPDTQRAYLGQRCRNWHYPRYVKKMKNKIKLKELKSNEIECTIKDLENLRKEGKLIEDTNPDYIKKYDNSYKSESIK